MRYAVVVPTLFVSRTLDVGPEVRAKLGLEVYEVGLAVRLPRRAEADGDRVAD